MSPKHGPGDSNCTIYTFKEGLLSGVAHDLKLEAQSFEIEIGENSLSASFDPRSISVVCAMKNGKEEPGILTEKDRHQIEENMLRDVLDPRQFPAITFRSTELIRETQLIRVRGDLSLHGRTRSIGFLARSEAGRFVAEVTLHQTDFGIQPFSAMFGAIKIQPDIRVELSVPA